MKTKLRIGMVIRVMGPQATRETISACAHAAEAAGIDQVWISDHIAIPPDDAEGSGGRYLDPLATLAYLAARPLRNRLLARLMLDQIAYKMPFGLYRKLRLSRWLVPRPAAGPATEADSPLA